jgi:hypothetical protein
VDADALDLEREIAAVQCPHLPLANEPDGLLGHLLRVANLLDPLDHELPAES